MSYKLNQILEDFQEKQKNLPDDREARIDELAELFKPIAKHLLGEGCFEVYSGTKLIRRVFPFTVEFYYHEEEGDVKDYIVYHKGVDDYFKPGTINAHQSGIDITFENQDAKYRASALIRAFRVIDSDDIHAPFKKGYRRSTRANREDVEYRSSYIYDYLFTNIPLPITVQWADCVLGNDCDLKQGYRVNVFEYDPACDKTNKPTKSDKRDRKPWAFSLDEFKDPYRITKRQQST